MDDEDAGYSSVLSHSLHIAARASSPELASAGKVIDKHGRLSAPFSKRFYRAPAAQTIMAKFVTKNASQKTTDVMLLSEVHGVRETFCDFRKVLHPVTEENDNIAQNGVSLSGE
eukprot:IDg15819t1